MEAVEFLNASDPMPSEVIGSFDRTHRLAMSGIWEIPVGRGRRFGGQLPPLVNGAVGGWQLNGVVTRQSGAPLGFGNAIFTGDLKDIVLPKSERDVDRWADYQPDIQHPIDHNGVGRGHRQHQNEKLREPVEPAIGLVRRSREQNSDQDEEIDWNARKQQAQQEHLFN